MSRNEPSMNESLELQPAFERGFHFQSMNQTSPGWGTVLKFIGQGIAAGGRAQHLVFRLSAWTGNGIARRLMICL